MVRHLLLDGYNLMHRARGGFKGAGEHPIVYNFFVSLRALVEMFSPGKITFVLEGSHASNTQALPSYKANRRQSDDITRKQFKTIIECLRNLPISIAVNPDHEADDTIYNIIKNGNDEEFIVVSSDSDFTQLLQRCSTNCRIWNWKTKSFLENPNYDYVTWKSFAGDKTDNIPSVKQAAKQAIKLASSSDTLEEFLRTSSKDVVEQFIRNRTLISFYDFQISDVVFSEPQVNYDAMRVSFEMMGFASIIEEKRWKKYVKTFEQVENKH